MDIFIVWKKLEGIPGGKPEEWKQRDYCKTMQIAMNQMERARQDDIYYNSKFKITKEYMWTE